MHKSEKERFSFVHLHNDDGTFDSICPSCFHTIAQSAREAGLQNAEDSHVCDPSLVAHYRVLSKAVSAYRVESRGHVFRGTRPMRVLRP